MMTLRPIINSILNPLRDNKARLSQNLGCVKDVMKALLIVFLLFVALPEQAFSQTESQQTEEELEEEALEEGCEWITIDIIYNMLYNTQYEWKKEKTTLCKQQGIFTGNDCL